MNDVYVHTGLPFPTRDSTPEDAQEARQLLGYLCWGNHGLPEDALRRVMRAYYLLGGDAYVNAEVERAERESKPDGD